MAPRQQIKQSEALKVIAQMSEAAIALETEHDPHKFLDKVLSHARKIVGAVAGTLYLVKDNQLFFSVCQNDEIDINKTINTHHASSSLPVDLSSIAGYVANTGSVLNIPDVYTIPPKLPYRFNPSVDQSSGFKTKAVLALPMQHPSQGIIGVLEIINPHDGCFNVWNTGLAKVFASLAAVSVVNMNLQDSLQAAYRDTLFHLGVAAEYRDEDTYDHIQRIRYTSRILARQLGFSDEDQDIIFHASAMHDLGKIGVPDAVLNKPGSLDDKEWNIMQSHAEKGDQILEGAKAEILHISAIIARHHHERWDGNGYPDGLSGEDIPVFARIVTVADVFDALVHKRVYKPAWPSAKALALLKSERGKQFDARIVDAFFTCQKEILEVMNQFGEKTKESTA